MIARIEVGPFAALATGPAGGEVVLCLHGFPDHAPTFEALLGELAARGRRAVAPWLRGYAPSTREGPFGIEALGADVLAMADALSPDRPVALVGHDWGAMAAYAACAAAPTRIRRAVTLAVPHLRAFLGRAARRPRQLLRSWYVFFFQIAGVAERALVLRDQALVERLWRDWSPGFHAPPAFLEGVKRCLAASLPGPLGHYRALPRGARGLRAVARRIAVPTLHLHGADDGCVGAELAEGEERWFTGEFRREVLAGVGHFLHLEDPARVNARILGWLT